MAAIVSAITGVYLSGGNTETGSISFSGLFHCPAVSTWLCTLSCHNESAKDRTNEGITAYFLCIPLRGILLFIGIGTVSQLQPISEWHTAGNLILLALIPTVVSNLALVRAVKASAPHSPLCWELWSR